MISLLIILFFFTSLAHSYTWVKLEDYENGTVWYDPSIVEKEEGVSSVLIKTYIREDDQNIVVWVVIDCKAKRCYFVGPLLVDENDKALEFEDDVIEEDIVFGSGSVAEDLYNMLCSS